jgi:hypothetical protein
MSQLWGMSKIPASAANCGLLAKFSSVSFLANRGLSCRWVRSASGDDGRKLFQHVGHRGPVYKGLGAMNPCDNLHLHLLYCCHRVSTQLKLTNISYVMVLVAQTVKLIANRHVYAAVKANVKMLYAFFWVIPWRLKFICRRLGKLCYILICANLPINMEQTECSETSAYKLQTPGNYPKESIQHLEHGESLKSRNAKMLSSNFFFLSLRLNICILNRWTFVFPGLNTRFVSW